MRTWGHGLIRVVARTATAPYGACAQVDPVDDTDLTHINLLKYEPEHEQKVIVEIPFNVVNHDKSPGTRPFQ